METIELVDAARYFKGLPHQIDAWNWLQQQLTPEQLDGFATRFRTAPATESLPPLVSQDQCQAIFGRVITPQQWNDLNNCLHRFEIDTPERIRQFMAQIAHESGGLRWLKELDDGTAYEGRRDLGNTQPGDGPRFKGAGALQLTGRDNYEQFAKFIGDPKVMEGCDYVADTYPFTSAGFWWHNNRMNALVDAGASCREVSSRVNGRDPANGLDDREAYYAKACAVIPDAPCGTAAVPAELASKTLQVIYYSQRKSATDQAYRMCFSSSCAMLLNTLKPGVIPGGEDEYLQRVMNYGDSTDAQAQMLALASYGVKASLKTNADFSTVESQINQGLPVPCGFLHHGPVEAPTGGGHWLCVIGYNPTAVIVNDPFGELDLLCGNYISDQGAGLSYSRKNFGRRWMVDSTNNNAYAPGQGWAVIAERPAT